MANTPFLDLVKPAGTDKALVSVINSNSDKIDGGVSTLSEQIGNYIDSGICKRLTSGTAVKSVSQNGRYYAVNAPDTPSGVSQSGFLDVYVFADGYKRLIYHPVDVSSVYVTSAYGGTWKEWQQLAAGTEFNTVSISTLSALQTYLDNMPVGKTSTLILSGEASSTVCGSSYISSAIATKIDSGFVDLRWARSNEDSGITRYRKSNHEFLNTHDGFIGKYTNLFNSDSSTGVTITVAGDKNIDAYKLLQFELFTTSTTIGATQIVDPRVARGNNVHRIYAGDANTWAEYAFVSNSKDIAINRTSSTTVRFRCFGID